jgi:hypothetical protein
MRRIEQFPGLRILGPLFDGDIAFIAFVTLEHVEKRLLQFGGRSRPYGAEQEYAETRNCSTKQRRYCFHLPAYIQSSSAATSRPAMRPPMKHSDRLAPDR